MRSRAPLAALLIGMPLVGLVACGVPDPEPSPLRLEISTPGDTPPAARGGSGAGEQGRWASPWYPGAGPVALAYGCTTALAAVPDRRCPSGQGFHPGTDVSLPCGTVVTAGVAGTVLDPSAPARPEAAYGPNALRVRTASGDVLLGHARRLLVRPGARVDVGAPLLEVGDLGDAQGCRLHLQVRAVGGDVTTASDPSPVLHARSAP